MSDELTREVTLSFGDFELKASIFSSNTAQKILKNKPYKINLTRWGNEAYGSIKLDINQENSVNRIPPGGLAYSEQGNYFCIFFGQTPAWPVEYIGQIEGESWKRLLIPFPLLLEIY